MLTATIEQLLERHQSATEDAVPEKPSRGLAVLSLTPQLARELEIPDTVGVLVRAVEDSSPAAEAGIKAGDVIVEVDHHSVKTLDDLNLSLRQHPSDTPVLLLVHRRHESFFTTLP